jgi:hypothetical protein
MSMTCGLTMNEAASSRGQGPEAEFVVLESNRLHSEWVMNSVLFGQMTRVRDELIEVFQETANENWDGHGARAVAPEVLEVARKVLAALPLGLPMPSVGAEPDGQLTLEWYHSPRQTLSVSVSPDGDLHYAALLGASLQSGTEPFYGVVPRAILELVSRIVPE